MDDERPDDPFDGDDFDDEFDGEDDLDDLDLPLDAHETQLVEQDLLDLADFEATFQSEGFRGVAVWCHDCVEEHYFPWDMLRENLRMLLDTGETPVHEPAFQPEPDRYVPWDYARGYVDALKDVGANLRLPLEQCPRCAFPLEDDVTRANFCPRCGTTLLAERLRDALTSKGMTSDDLLEILAQIGLPTRAVEASGHERALDEDEPAEDD